MLQKIDVRFPQQQEFIHYRGFTIPRHSTCDNQKNDNAFDPIVGFQRAIPQGRQPIFQHLINISVIINYLPLLAGIVHRNSLDSTLAL